MFSATFLFPSVVALHMWFLGMVRLSETGLSLFSAGRMCLNVMLEGDKQLSVSGGRPAEAAVSSAAERGKGED